MDLFAPYRLGGPVGEHWTLRRIAIEQTRIVVRGISLDGRAATFSLEYPTGRGRAVSDSFVATDVVAPGDAADEFVEPLLAAVRRHDPGNFWRVSRSVQEPSTGSQGWEVTAGTGVGDWSRDGLLLFGLLVGTTTVLAGRKLRAAPVADAGEPANPASTNHGLRDALLLVGILVLGAVLRLLMVEPTALGVWPYSRYETFARLVYEGPGLAALSRALDSVWYQTDIAFATNLAFGLVAPLVVFVHACYLLGDRRQALVSALLLALLPSHIRFSGSEVAFIPSIVISSFTFVLLHMSLIEKRAWLRWGACAGLALTAGAMLRVRPLNILFMLLFIAVALVVRAGQAPRWRRFVVAAMLAVVGLVVGIEHLGGLYSEQVHAGLQLQVLADAWWLLFDPVRNALLNPDITPMLLVGAAGYGLWFAAKTRPRLAGLLASWLLLFHTGHAYVIATVPAMQARYYLHLAVPFCLLAAIGLTRIAELCRRRGRRGNLAIGCIGIYLATIPWRYHGFIRDYDFTDVREFEFVRQLRGQLADGCTIYEFVGHDGRGFDTRFSRMGAVIDSGTRRMRLSGQSVGTDREDLLPNPEVSYRRLPTAGESRTQLLSDAYLERPADRCSYLYLGYPCYANKFPGQEIAPACEAMVEGEPVELVTEIGFAHRRYDDNLAAGAGPDGGEIRLMLYRLRER